MDYEKLYREANKKVAVRFGSNVAKELFPDLYESKDERTRIYIINHLREHLKTVIEFLNNGMSAPFSSEEIEMLEASVAWLEKQGEQKQGEQKPVNRLKTTAGNWYVCEMEVTNENMTTAFHRGEVYYCPNDGYIDVNGALFEVGTLDVFRLATKEEIPQPKQEWSEEDEAFYQRLEQIVCKVDIEAFQGDVDLHSWLKSLRPQNTWKPSKEQMYWLKNAIDSLDTISVRPSRQNLESLYNDLKKLV